MGGAILVVIHSESTFPSYYNHDPLFENGTGSISFPFFDKIFAE